MNSKSPDLLLLQILHKTSDSLNFATSANAETSIPKWLDNNLVSALIGALASFVVFYFTLRHERKRERNEQVELQKKKLNYLSALISGIIAYGNSQNKNIADMIQKISESPFDFPLMTFAPKADLERAANGINQEDYFHAYLTNYGSKLESVKDFKNIFSAIDYLHLQYDQLLEMIKISASHDNERKLNFKKLLNDASELAATHSVQLEMSGRTDFIQFLHTHWETFISKRTEESDIRFAFENFVEPVKMGIATKFADIPVAVAIANLLQKASLIYSDIPKQLLAIQEDYQAIHKSIDKAVKGLEEKSKSLLNDFLGFAAKQE
ncbi:MAG: hypothetical protein JST27_04915 [Bacteroidetes bacterium]|nr:hypothetical protein [Bacteroidota bacterium]